MLAVALVSIAVAVFYGKAWFEKAQLESARERLVRETVLAGAILDRLGEHTSGLPQLAAILDMPEERLSLLNSKGSVLGDTAPGAQPVTRLDNHADRPEVREAMAGKPGFTIRPSGTLGTDLAYAAVALQNGDILRVSVPLVSLRQIIDSAAALVEPDGVCGGGHIAWQLSASPAPHTRARIRAPGGRREPHGRKYRGAHPRGGRTDSTA